MTSGKKNRIEKRPWLIVIAGAPGTGKSTLSEALARKLGGFVFEIGILRQIHLDKHWSNVSSIEEKMTFENYLAMLKNYRIHGIGPVIGGDLPDNRILKLLQTFPSLEWLLVTLTVSNRGTHKRRILDPKADRGFRRYDAAWAWNEKVMAREVLAGEMRLASDQLSVEKEVKLVHEVIQDPSRLTHLRGGKLDTSKIKYFDLDAYFEKYPIPPWSEKKGRHVNEGWEKALA